MRASTLLISLLTTICCLVFTQETPAQERKAIRGYTDIEYDNTTSTITAYSETSVDYELGPYYEGYVELKIYKDGVLIASQSDYDGGSGFSSLTLQFTATPGSTYLAKGYHNIESYLYDYDDYYPFQVFYYDNWWFGRFESQNISQPWYYTFLDNGFQQLTRRAKSIRIGGTYSSAVASVPAVSIRITQANGASLASPFRVGISSTGYSGAVHDRTQHLKAVVTPSSQAANVTIQVSSGLTLSNQQTSNGIITFDVVGNTKSTNKGDAWIKAQHSSGSPVTKKVSVVIPHKVGLPHDTVGGGLVAKNMLADSSTSPAGLGLPPGYVYLITAYIRYLNVIVKDQFGENIGSLYQGAEVAEYVNFLWRPINQSLTAASTYADPVGEIIVYGYALRESSIAQQWTTQPLQPMVEGSETRTVTVAIDGF